MRHFTRLLAPFALLALLLLCTGAMLARRPAPAYDPIADQAKLYQLSKTQADDAATAHARQTGIALLWLAMGGLPLAAGAVALHALYADRRRRRELLVPDHNGLYPLLDPRVLAQSLAPQLAQQMIAQMGATMVAGQMTASIAAQRRAAPAIMAEQRELLPAPAQTSEDDRLSVAPAVDFASLLSTFTPSKEALLLAVDQSGRPVTVPAAALWHVALSGATGNGKTNIARLLLAQLLACGANVALGDPKWTPFDLESGDDFRPLAARLARPPAATASELADLLGWASDELDRRLAARRAVQPVGVPMFIYLDELPTIAADVDGASATIERLARVGRGVNLLLLSAAQDWLTKSTKSGAGLRDQFRTAYYVGGDGRSAAPMLDMAQREISVYEHQLGQGIALLRSRATPAASLVRVPLASNDAIYALLGRPSEALPASARSATPAAIRLDSQRYGGATVIENSALLGRSDEINAVSAAGATGATIPLDPQASIEPQQGASGSGSAPADGGAALLVTAEERAAILTAWADERAASSTGTSASRRAVCKRAFDGATGGAAYNKVKQVLDEAGL